MSDNYDPLYSFRRPADGLPWFINLIITARCNLYCHSCASASVNMPMPPKEKVLAFIDHLAEWLPTPRMVIVTGGEPLMHPNIMEFLERLSRHGFITTLNSNGSLLNVEKVEQLKRLDLRVLNLSLDGIGELHDRLRNAPGLFQGVMDILYYMSHNTDFLINAITQINAVNAYNLPDLVRYVTGKPKFRVFRFQAIVPTLSRPWTTDFFKESHLWPRTDAELTTVLKAMDELEELREQGYPINNPHSQFEHWRRYFRDPFNFRGNQGCRVAYDNFQSMPDGTVNFCDKFPALGTIEDDPKTLWESPEAEKMRKEMSRCTRPCNYTVNCCFLEEEGGCALTPSGENQDAE